jgi:hypothetical protein
MARRNGNAARESLGTFPPENAMAIAAALKEREGIEAQVERLHVGERNDQPTEWWHVYVPARSALGASTWLRGWRAGNEYHLIESYRLNHGITYQDAAKRLGYGPHESPEEHIGHHGICGTVACREAKDREGAS